MPGRQDVERLEQALRGADLALWDMDLVSGETVVNARWNEMLGLPPDADMSARDDWIALIHPEDRERVLAAEQAHLDGRVPGYEAVYRLWHTRGEWVWVLDRGRVLARSADGRPRRMVGTHLDITARVQAEQAVQARERALTQVADQMPGLVSRVGLDGRYRFVNATYERWFGRPAAEVLGLTQRELLGEARYAELEPMIRRALAGETVRYESHVRLASGDRYVLGTLVPDRDAEGRVQGHYTFVTDISDRKRAEEALQRTQRQLAEAQKLEALGTLAGGIAHDFNNIVAGILGNAELAQRALPPDHPAAAALSQVQRAGQRARALVQQILSFSRRAAPATGVVDLRAVLEESIALLRATAPAGVRLEVQSVGHELPVQAEPTQLNQVLMNLCLNAWQALPPQGGLVQVRLEDRGPELCISVADDGSGMDEATRARIFDPFFTTKPPGQGTGLGLAVVHGIVQQHGGRIEVQSAPGQGSLFRVCFPRAQRPVTDEADEVDEPSPQPGRGQHVLYVDDEEMLRQVAQALLQMAGWRASTADGAAAALALLARGDVDLLVSDLHMPEVSGLALCERAAQACPGLPMLLCSGFVTEAQAEQARALGVREVLAKERLVEDLVPAVARAFVA